MDDIFCLVSYRRPGLRSSTAEVTDPATEFNNCLNEVHPLVQFTREDEVEKSIAFLDVHLTREDTLLVFFGNLQTLILPSNPNPANILPPSQAPSKATFAELIAFALAPNKLRGK